MRHKLIEYKFAHAQACWYLCILLKMCHVKRKCFHKEKGNGEQLRLYRALHHTHTHTEPERERVSLCVCIVYYIFIYLFVYLCLFFFLLFALTAFVHARAGQLCTHTGTGTCACTCIQNRHPVCACVESVCLADDFD